MGVSTLVPLRQVALRWGVSSYVVGRVLDIHGIYDCWAVGLIDGRYIPYLYAAGNRPADRSPSNRRVLREGVVEEALGLLPHLEKGKGGRGNKLLRTAPWITANQQYRDLWEEWLAQSRDNEYMRRMSRRQITVEHIRNEWYPRHQKYHDRLIDGYESEAPIPYYEPPSV